MSMVFRCYFPATAFDFDVYQAAEAELSNALQALPARKAMPSTIQRLGGSDKGSIWGIHLRHIFPNQW